MTIVISDGNINVIIPVYFMILAVLAVIVIANTEIMLMLRVHLPLCWFLNGVQGLVCLVLEIQEFSTSMSLCESMSVPSLSQLVAYDSHMQIAHDHAFGALLAVCYFRHAHYSSGSV